MERLDSRLLKEVHVMTAKEVFMAVHDTVHNHPDWPQLTQLVHELAFLDGGNDAAFTLANGRQSRWF